MAQAAETSNTELTHLAILDFEATCELPSGSHEEMEIIEFPTILYNLNTKRVQATFHEYVRPVIYPQLTDFCLDLTGISQERVDAADTFPAVWTRYLAFLKAQDVWDNPSALAFVTCGDWDLKTMLPQQLGLSFADDATKKHETEHVFFKRWINIKRSFYSVYGGKRRPGGLMSMLKALAITHQGRHHSGIDDCKNLLSIVERMRQDGWKAHKDPQLLLQR